MTKEKNVSSMNIREILVELRSVREYALEELWSRAKPLSTTDEYNKFEIIYARCRKHLENLEKLLESMPKDGGFSQSFDKKLRIIARGFAYNKRRLKKMLKQSELL